MTPNLGQLHWVPVPEGVTTWHLSFTEYFIGLPFKKYEFDVSKRPEGEDWREYLKRIYWPTMLADRDKQPHLVFSTGFTWEGNGPSWCVGGWATEGQLRWYLDEGRKLVRPT